MVIVHTAYLIHDTLALIEQRSLVIIQVAQNETCALYDTENWVPRHMGRNLEEALEKVTQVVELGAPPGEDHAFFHNVRDELRWRYIENILH